MAGECGRLAKIENLDCFIILENGGRWAMEYIQKNPSYIENTIFSERKLSYYHYNPPITIGFGLRQREGYKTNSTSNIFGTLEEKNFRKKGPAIIIDDSIDTGLTLNFARRFLYKKGYSSEEIFVFGKENHGRLKIEKFQYYKNKVRKTNKTLWRFIHENSCNP